MGKRIQLLAKEEYGFTRRVEFQVKVWGELFIIKYRPDPLASKQEFEDTWNTITIEAGRGRPNPLSMHQTVFQEHTKGRELQKFETLNDYARSVLFDMAERNKKHWARVQARKNQQTLFED